MIKLSKAMEEVKELVDPDRVPSQVTLRRWASKNIITGVAEGKKHGAVYPNIVVLEIAAAIELKERFTLKEISKFRNDVGFDIDKDISASEFIELLNEYVDQLEDKQENLKANVENGNKSIDELEKGIDELKKIKNNLNILKDYHQILTKTLDKM